MASSFSWIDPHNTGGWHKSLLFDGFFYDSTEVDHRIHHVHSTWNNQHYRKLSWYKTERAESPWQSSTDKRSGYSHATHLIGLPPCNTHTENSKEITKVDADYETKTEIKEITKLYPSNTKYNQIIIKSSS